MQAFQYNKVSDIETAVGAGSAAGVKFIAGGTTLSDLMKLHVEQPTTVVDINSLPLDKIERTADGGLTIGAMVRNSDLAHDATCSRNTQCCRRRCCPGLRRNSATWRQPGGTSCNARAATTFAIPPTPVTSGSPGQAVRHLMDITASMRSWARASTALPHIRRIWRWQ